MKVQSASPSPHRTSGQSRRDVVFASASLFRCVGPKPQEDGTAHLPSPLVPSHLRFHERQRLSIGRQPEFRRQAFSVDRPHELLQLPYFDASDNAAPSRRRRQYGECRGLIRLWLETKFRQSPVYAFANADYGRPRLRRGDSGEPGRGDPVAVRCRASRRLRLT
jgi:hypothetical protein